MERYEVEFIKCPKYEFETIDKVWENMIGHKYIITDSSCVKGEYIILGGATEEAEKEYQDSIYKSLIEIGESEEFAKEVAYENEDSGMVLTFPKYCFKFEEVKNGKDE